MTPDLYCDGLSPKARDELAFWQPIAQCGFRGFSREEYRQAAVHYRQYGLIQIGRDRGCLRDKQVVEIGCGPTPIVYQCGAARAIGIDPLADVYAKLWDLSGDGIEYFAQEIETFSLDFQADIVICWNGIDHVRDLQQTMKQILRLLRDDGELWTFTNLEGSRLTPWYRRNRDATHHHQYFFGEWSLNRFFRSQGWRWETKFKYEPKRGSYLYRALGGVLQKVRS